MVLEGAFDELVENVGGYELVDIGTRKISCEWLWCDKLEFDPTFNDKEGLASISGTTP